MKTANSTSSTPATSARKSARLSFSTLSAPLPPLRRLGLRCGVGFLVGFLRLVDLVAIVRAKK
ncbi:MAG: hypothetical protein BroJett021_22650 [Chloroflexota bacterium]|nr:MAG: hypothetical protein BroJett021_22650 [Chloroflexota bacterium]